MASKNLRKIRQMGLSGFGFSDDFDPSKYSVNWERFEKYVAHKEASVLYQSIFKPLYKKMVAEELGQYFKGGHKLNSALKREIKSSVKERAKEIAQAQITAASNSTKQSIKEQEVVLAEG
jgi:hypothetical protein